MTFERTSRWTMLAPLAALSAALVACAAEPASESTATREEALCSESYDWHDFPTGYQCVGGSDAFYKAHFGLTLPALCQYPTKNGCASCGACQFWVADAPDPAVWDRMTTGTPQLFDMMIYPPVSGNAYGHVAVVDHVSGGQVYVMDDNFVAYQTKASCPHTVSSAAMGWYRLKSLQDKPVTGKLEAADCAAISGFAFDADTPSKAVTVDVRYDGDLTAPVHATVTAGDSRADLCTSLGSCAHAFTLAPPHALLDGKPHTARAYATDTGTGLKVLLPGSPKTFTCAPPTDAAAPPASADGGAADAATSEPSAPGPNDSPATEPPGADGGAQSAEAPQPGGCSAAPGSPSSLPWSSLALLALALYARRRAAAPARR